MKTGIDCNDIVKIKISINGHTYFMLERLCNSEEEFEAMLVHLKYLHLKDMSLFSGRIERKELEDQS